MVHPMVRASLMDELRAQLEHVIDLHERDCEEGCDGVFLRTKSAGAIIF